MVTEDYVSFETAKLLKEKGFDWLESPFYSEQDRDEWRQNNNYTIPNMEYNPDLPFDSETLTIVAPHVSTQMVMKWLREVHNIAICISAYYAIDPYELNHRDNKPYWKIRIMNRISSRDYDSFNTYEEACEAGIRYCLEKLI